MAVAFVVFVVVVPSGRDTLDPYAKPFYSRPTALTQEGMSQVDDVCECMRD